MVKSSRRAPPAGDPDDPLQSFPVPMMRVVYIESTVLTSEMPEVFFRSI